jgi:ABC-type antimicrobial peptide transport system permease subunit
VLLLGGVGLVVGLAATWETTAFLKAFLFGLKPDDPWTLGAAAAILMAAAMLAGFVPAWRAARIDPMVALRHE